jgi:hypothetical protein
MAFNRSEFEAFYRFLKSSSLDPDINKRSIAENFLLEERLTGEREESYHSYIESPPQEETWATGHENYVIEKIHIRPGSPNVPETFKRINGLNLRANFNDDQYIVRLESIGRFLERFGGKSANEMMTHFNEFIKNPADRDNANVIKDFLFKWNRNRDHRPIFAGFWGEVKNIFTDAAGSRIETKDWPNRIRDSFGLGGLNPNDGEHIPVLLLRYRVREVIEFYNDNNSHMAIPTVLDGRFSSYFYPTPKKDEWNTGQVLDLNTGDEDDYSFYSEILHSFIEYEPKFIYDAGWITGSPGKTLEEAREIHMKYLAEEFENSL